MTDRYEKIRLIAASNPSAVTELLDRLEAAESETVSWKGLATQFGQERDALRAKVAEMEQQEPVAWTTKLALELGKDTLGFHIGIRNLWGEKGVALYALPGAQPAPSFADAYQGAMEEVAIWKRRALDAEDLNRKFIAEINSPTHMGEPALRPHRRTTRAERA